MTSYFISDLHLSSACPERLQHFMQFLDESAQDAKSLYILGDLFEVWLGDDVVEPELDPVFEKLQQISRSGIKLFIMPGNRDFLMGKKFAQRCGATLLRDPSVIEIDQQKVLLMHGDLLCSNDKGYLRFRRFVQNPLIKKLFCCLPVSWRQTIARHLRNKSTEKATKLAEQKSVRIYQVVKRTVIHFLEKFKVSTVIHGHTHTPLIDKILHNDQHCERYNLGEWLSTGSVLKVEQGQFELKQF